MAGNAAGGGALETLLLPAAYCVSYAEAFVAGDAQNGAYVCHLVLSEPDGFTIQAGGPAGAFVAPAPREHGLPGAAALAGAGIGGAQAALPFVAGADGVPRLPRITGAPPFTVKGPKNGKPGLDRVEFTRQLTGQQEGLNRLTVAQFLANRDQYLKKATLTGDGRAAKGDAAQQVARKAAFQDKINELRDQDENLTEKEARQQAQQWLDTQTALHDPDQVAGGHPDSISGMGDARVNYSIGAQWPKRIKAIDSQIRRHAAGMTQQERENTFLDIALPIA